ncbi:MAG: lipid A export permease/ATP-binding protein MsbA [Halioglobus sp.]
MAEAAAGAPKPGDWALYRRLLAQLAPQARYFFLSLGGYALYSMGVVLLADLMQFLLDSLDGAQPASGGLLSSVTHYFTQGSDYEALDLARTVVPVAIVLLALLRALGYFGGSYFMNHVARNMIHDLRCRLFDRMLLAPADYFDRNSQGVLLAKITYNVEQVTGAVTRALRTLLRETLVVAGLLSYMLYLNWRLCLVFLAVTPLIALVVNRVGRLFRRYSQRIQDSMGEVAQIAGESINAWRELRLYGAQQQQRRRFTEASEYNRSQSLKLAKADAISTPVIQTLLASAMAVIVWFALQPDILGAMTPGALVAFLVAAVQLGKPVRQLSSIQSLFQRGLAAAEDIFRQLDQASEQRAGGARLGRVEGEIEFRHVSFTYPGADQQALSDVSLRINAGETVALVGPSGAGKSTLVQLLAGFYRPEAGDVLLDGQSVLGVDLIQLRAQLALVAQRPPLLRDTVYNNVAFGELAGATEQAVSEALQMADAAAFVEELPQGLHTRLGADGDGLSGGQRQRLAIARALLKDAPVLILDEATSALDNESERAVQEVLQRSTAGKTTLVIAHRLSTVEQADRVVVLDRGAIVEQGTHQQLLQAGGLYARLYQRELVD